VLPPFSGRNIAAIHKFFVQVTEKGRNIEGVGQFAGCSKRKKDRECSRHGRGPKKTNKKKTLNVGTYFVAMRFERNAGGKKKSGEVASTRNYHSVTSYKRGGDE